MTPTQVVSAVRERYNAVGDSFFADAEIYDYIYNGELELAHEKIIQNTYSTATVTSTSNYTIPTLAMSVQRIEYNGKKLRKSSYREVDALTLQNTANEGNSAYYKVWGDQVYLTPIPDAANTLKFYTYDFPDVLSSGAVLASGAALATPAQFHMDLVNFCLKMMAIKDENPVEQNLRQGLWNESKRRARHYHAMNKRADGFAVVQDEESLDETALGIR